MITKDVTTIVNTRDNIFLHYLWMNSLDISKIRYHSVAYDIVFVDVTYERVNVKFEFWREPLEVKDKIYKI